MTNENNIHVIYHKNCLDGIAAAAAVVNKFGIERVTTHPLTRGYSFQSFLDIYDKIEDKSILYIVDFNLETMKEHRMLSEKCVEIVIIDHHIGAKETLNMININFENIKVIFDVEHSGAALTWDYMEEGIPKLVDYIEDRDLWTKKYGDDTEKINLALWTLKDSHKDPVIPILDVLKKDVPDLLMLSGDMLLKQRDSYIKQFIESNHKSKTNPRSTIALSRNMGFYEVQIFNSSTCHSEIGNYYAKKNNEVVCIYCIEGQRVKLSFRSVDGCEVTALQCAKQFGGGGHTHAAGATTTISIFFDLDY